MTSGHASRELQRRVSEHLGHYMPHHNEAVSSVGAEGSAPAPGPSFNRLQSNGASTNSISSQIMTPVSAQDLASSLISELESNIVSPISAPNDVTFDILLAEDNLVNQKLAEVDVCQGKRNL